MSHDKETINLGNSLTYLAGRLRDGLRAISGSPLRLLLAVLFWLTAAVMIHAAAADNIVARLLQPLAWILAGLLFLTVVTATAIPRGTLHMANACRRIGLVNDCGEAPLLIKRYHKEDKIMVDLFTQGISLATIQDNLSELEAAANCRVVRVEQGVSRNIIRLTLAPGDAQLPEKAILPRLTIASSEIAMGVSYDGPVITDLNKVPHWLMGGATGSGKTTLLVVFIQQCLMKVTATGKQAVDVYIIDLKGGQDYPPHWRNRDCSFCVTAEDALSVLGRLVTELEQRLKLFSDASERFGVPCSSLDEYNRLCSGAPLRRNVIVIDELAEITDTTGMDKPHKELAAAVVGKLATIARLGRAVGFNLVIGVQRGDANVVPGQIKSNISGRVCGVADDTLSRIILGNGDADTLIPKHGRGLFLNQDGVMFRGYLPIVAPRPKAESAPSEKEGGTNEHPHV